MFTTINVRLLALCLLLSGILIFLAASTISFRRPTSEPRTEGGLEDALCKCEKFNHNSSGKPVKPRIVNGSKFTSKHGLSWLVSIYHGIAAPPTLKDTEMLYNRICTGSLLNSRFVITASHCFKNFYYDSALSLAGLWVAAGSDHDLHSIYCRKITSDSFGIKMCDFRVQDNYTKKVKKVHTHPRYIDKFSIRNETRAKDSEQNNNYDIALLEVEPFELSDEINVLPACPFGSDEQWFGELFFAGLFC